MGVRLLGKRRKRRKREEGFSPKNPKGLDGFIKRSRQRHHAWSGKICHRTTRTQHPGKPTPRPRHNNTTSMLVLVVALLGFGACDAFFAGSLSVPRAPLTDCGRHQQVCTAAAVGEVALFRPRPNHDRLLHCLSLSPHAARTAVGRYVCIVGL